VTTSPTGIGKICGHDIQCAGARQAALGHHDLQTPFANQLIKQTCEPWFVRLVCKIGL
jgi:hypothetical protein